jgi:hypothetical protein
MEIIAKFLYNQSVGSSINQISEILNYFQNKLSKNKELLDFAFEWIRANKIRLEYKKYITLDDYNTYNIALDDCIFLFFLKYDEFLSALFEESMKEYEFCSLYQIFFNPNQSNPAFLITLLEKNKVRVPTIIVNGEKINTKIHTLREGLSEMIKADYNERLPSDIKFINYEKKELNKGGNQKEFDGTMVERLLKFYCFQKRKIDNKEFTLAINQFLSSYFQFSIFYNFNDFKKKLILSFADYIHSGLTKNYNNQSIESLQSELLLIIEEFEKNLKQVRLKGKAWIEDLRPILQNYIEKFVERL